MKIRFTEARLLLSGERVEAGEERDFGESENSAFVKNHVAEYVTEEKQQDEAPAAGEQTASEEVKSNG